MNKKIAKKIYKLTAVNRGGDWLAERAAEREHYMACIEAGHVGIIRSGMDCDCSSYHREGIYPALPYRVWLQNEDHHASWLDGPERTYVVRPSKIKPENSYTRDLALEAFEDGHAHSIHWSPA
jgi:hypothetical protein